MPIERSAYRNVVGHPKAPNCAQKCLNVIAQFTTTTIKQGWPSAIAKDSKLGDRCEQGSAVFENPQMPDRLLD